MIVPTKLIKRRFLGPVLQFDIDQYQTENSGDEDIVFIENSIPAIAVITEILTVTRELHLMHEVVAQSEPEREAKDDYDRHNWTISYEPINCVSKADCSIHFAEVRELIPPEIVIPGLPKNHPRVIAANQKQANRRKRLKKLKIMKAALKAMQVMNLTWDVLDIDKAQAKADQVKE
jgi:hypothetical protein